MYTNDSARQANQKLDYQRAQYESTTIHLLRLTNCLDDVKHLLSEILEVLRKDS